MNFVEKVGNIKVYTERNGKDDITVNFINGCDCVMSEVYFTDSEKKAIENLFQKLDTYTEEFLLLFVNGLEKVQDNLYKTDDEYFRRIDKTRFFKHFNHKPMV